MKAMREGIESLDKNKTHTPVELSRDRKVFKKINGSSG